MESLPPTTTIQEDKTTAGQRRINLIWEGTQSIVALGITGAAIYCGVKGVDSDMINNSFFLIVGFYFSRTNHQSIGGIGSKPLQPYEGR
jgi:hypothetical protein